MLAITLVTFAAFGIDKWKARHGQWRISEATLLLLAVVGGSVGAWLGMRLWHHKTLHRKFSFGVPFIFILQVAAVLYLLYLR